VLLDELVDELRVAIEEFVMALELRAATELWARLELSAGALDEAIAILLAGTLLLGLVLLVLPLPPPQAVRPILLLSTRSLSLCNAVISLPRYRSS
jgi:hypothetical protein